MKGLSENDLVTAQGLQLISDDVGITDAYGVNAIGCRLQSVESTDDEQLLSAESFFAAMGMHVVDPHP